MDYNPVSHCKMNAEKPLSGPSLNIALGSISSISKMIPSGRTRMKLIDRWPSYSVGTGFALLATCLMESILKSKNYWLWMFQYIEFFVL